MSWKMAVELNFFSESINQVVCMCSIGKQTDSCKLSPFINNLLYNPLLKEKQIKIKTKTLEILANGSNPWVFYSYPFVLLPDDCLNQWTGRKSISEIRSDQISRSVVSDSLRPHESQHARPPCPSPTPGVHSDSHPSSQ